jgi:hypothetical protein
LVERAHLDSELHSAEVVAFSFKKLEDKVLNGFEWGDS